MDPRKLAQRYPGLRLQELERHVARYKRKKDARGSGRVWSSQKSRSPSHGTQADAPREADRERHPRVRFVPREASSGAASSTRRVWGPKAAGKPGEASSSAAEVQGEQESGGTRQKSEDAWTVLSSDDSDASVFNLRGGVYASDGEWSDGEESLVSSDNEDAEVERHKVAQWRQAEFLQNDNDFA